MDFYYTSTDLLTASAVILAKGGLLHGVHLIPAAAASSVAIYDNATAASGKIVLKAAAVANGASVHVDLNYPLPCLNGIYASVSGSAAAFIVHYSIA